MNVIQNSKKKEPFVYLLLENRELLFSNYDDSKGITKEKKRQKWIEIQEKLESLAINFIPEGKNWTYLRDVVYRNLVDNLKRKLDKKRQTGSGKVELTHIETIVLGKLKCSFNSISFN